jgi:hypothetical protein
VGQYGIHHIAVALRGIESLLAASRHGSQLAVWVSDRDAHDETEQIERAMTGEWPSLARRSPHELVLAAGHNVLVRSAVR